MNTGGVTSFTADVFIDTATTVTVSKGTADAWDLLRIGELDNRIYIYATPADLQRIADAINTHLGEPS